MNSMNGLQTAPRNKTQKPASQPIDSAPTWLRYLAGAFPSAKVTSATYMVYEDQFTDCDPGLMLTAVRRAVKSHTWHTFPSVAELRQIVGGLEYDTAVENRQTVNLNAQRAALFEAAYAGEVDPAAWDALYRLFVATKRLDSAAALAVKFEAFSGGKLLAQGSR